jgi:hypothetical protein
MYTHMYIYSIMFVYMYKYVKTFWLCTDGEREREVAYIYIFICKSYLHAYVHERAGRICIWLQVYPLEANRMWWRLDANRMWWRHDSRQNFVTVTGPTPTVTSHWRDPTGLGWFQNDPFNREVLGKVSKQVRNSMFLSLGKPTLPCASPTIH